jgi:1,4-dihydroxy-6-naphthoate synthase
MKLSLGFSPCPNDTFIFDALVNNKINTSGLSFDVILEDVETLNQWALQGKLDITKLSYGVLPLVLDKYILLNSGSALGSGVGPLLIKNEELKTCLPVGKVKNVDDFVVAIPGEHTTAHLLFSLAYPNAKNKIFMRYDKIEEFILKSTSQVSPTGGDLEGALGVIIHENRFTYQAKGLEKIIDLGDYWEKETGNAIPLGGITIKRSIPTAISLQVDKLIKESIEYAYKHHYKELTNYVKKHSQEMSEEVMRKHIDLYVNNYSINLGDDGMNAVKKLISIYQQLYNSKKINAENIFLQ